MAIDGWQINPGDVQRILNRCDPALETVSGTADDVREQDADGADSPEVGTAVAAFFEARRPAVASLADRMGALHGGTSQVVQAYLRGDEDMAIEQQRAAAKVGGLGAVEW